jgi:hypothetical protein
MANDPSKPVHVPDCTQAMLRALYNEQGFDEQLNDPNKCRRIDIIPRRRRKPEDTFHPELTEYEEQAKYKRIDAEPPYTVAVIFWYTDIAGKITETIRSLRVGNTVYDAASRPDSPKQTIGQI